MDTQEIQAVHAVLHLISHRNKNQHQRAKWWKWLARLKRTAIDLGSQNASVAIPAFYKQYLSAHLIPRCYLYVSLYSTSAGGLLDAGDGRGCRI
jgi:ribonuclease MRP protein subunit RMP1